MKKVLIRKILLKLLLTFFLAWGLMRLPMLLAFLFLLWLRSVVFLVFTAPCVIRGG